MPLFIAKTRLPSQKWLNRSSGVQRECSPPWITLTTLGTTSMQVAAQALPHFLWSAGSHPTCFSGWHLTLGIFFVLHYLARKIKVGRLIPQKNCPHLAEHKSTWAEQSCRAWIQPTLMLTSHTPVCAAWEAALPLLPGLPCSRFEWWSVSSVLCPELYWAPQMSCTAKKKGTKLTF